jgi:hypothetical protein
VPKTGSRTKSKRNQFRKHTTLTIWVEEKEQRGIGEKKRRKTAFLMKRQCV